MIRFRCRFPKDLKVTKGIKVTKAIRGTRVIKVIKEIPDQPDSPADAKPRRRSPAPAAESASVDHVVLGYKAGLISSLLDADPQSSIEDLISVAESLWAWIAA